MTPVRPRTRSRVLAERAQERRELARRSEQASGPDLPPSGSDAADAIQHLRAAWTSAMKAKAIGAAAHITQALNEMERVK